MTTLAFLIHVSQSLGYPVLLVLVMSESSGVPVPGETSLITASLLASQGKLSIPLVILIAAGGAIIGDNIGYEIGRRGGRWVLERPGRFERQRHQVLATGEPFFERHGPKAVFFGRWILGLRVWASWLAGATRMPWPRFFFWNALGGISWATTVGLLSYFVGSSVKNAISSFGLIGLGIAVVTLVVGYLVHRRHRRSASARERPAPEQSGTPS